MLAHDLLHRLLLVGGAALLRFLLDLLGPGIVARLLVLVGDELAAEPLGPRDAGSLIFAGLELTREDPSRAFLLELLALRCRLRAFLVHPLDVLLRLSDELFGSGIQRNPELPRSLEERIFGFVGRREFLTGRDDSAPLKVASWVPCVAAPARHDCFLRFLAVGRLKVQ